MSIGLFIDLVVASLTLGTIYISYKAAKSAETSALVAKETAKYAEEQTKVMKSEYLQNITPKLFPKGMQLSFESGRSIREQLNGSKNVGVFDPSDMIINIKNVGRGNAYYIQSWIKLENFEDLCTESTSEDSELTNSFFVPYILTFIKKSGEKEKIVIQEKGMTEMHSYSLNIDHQVIPYDTLQAQENCNFNLSPYIHVLILDEIARRFYRRQDKGKYIFSLYIRYKTDAQLETKFYTESKYEVLAHSPSLSIRSGNSLINFGINFSPIYTINSTID